MKYGGKTSPEPFFKKTKLSISLDEQEELFYSLITSYKILKNEKRSGTIILNISRVTFY